jgi:cytochrome P450
VLSDPAPRPPRCYDPTVAPYRDADVVHVHDHATIRGLLRDARRVTSDVTGMLPPEQYDHVHPVSAFVWATDRMTISGCPGRHHALRTAMAPWFTASEAASRQGAARRECVRLAAREIGRPFDVYGDYALPLAVTYMAGWLGVAPSDVEYAVENQMAAGEMFETWPAIATPAMEDHYRDLMARPGLRGVAGQARDLVGSGAITEREAWGIVYSISVTSVATAASITLAVGLSVEHDLWHRMVRADDARAAIEEAIRLGNPFPQASRFAREEFTIGDVAVRPGDQVLMWLTAANRDLPGRHRQPLDRFDPWRDNTHQLGWGSGYHQCAGTHHARALATTAVTTLAEHCPDLGSAGPWMRFVGIDDGFSAAPAARFGPGRQAGDGWCNREQRSPDRVPPELRTVSRTRPDATRVTPLPEHDVGGRDNG